MVMVLTAVVSVTTAASMHLIATTQSDISRTVAKHGQLTLAEDLANSLQLKEVCSNTFESDAFNTVGPVPARIKWRVANSPPGRPQRLDSDSKVPDYNLIVNSLTIQNLRVVGNLSPPLVLYSGSLIMKAHSLNDNREFDLLKVTDLYFEVDSNLNRMTNCYGISAVLQLAQSSCSAIGGTIIPSSNPRNPAEGCSLKPNLPAVTCPAGQYMQGFNGNGAANCVAF